MDARDEDHSRLCEGSVDVYKYFSQRANAHMENDMEVASERRHREEYTALPGLMTTWDADWIPL